MLQLRVRRANSWTASLGAPLILGLFCSGAAAQSGVGPSPANGFEPRLASLLRGWFSLLESTPPESNDIGVFLAASPIDLARVALIEGNNPGSNDLRAWVSDLRSAYPQVEYELAAIRSEAIGPAEYRARFELDRRAVDGDGVLHIARSEHDWLIRDRPGETPEVLRIDSRRSLAIEGTGPRIVCY